MRQAQYSKLAGAYLLSVQSCYLGGDHLLILEGRYVERDRRIRYEDIEAVLICPTKLANVVALLSGLAGLIFTVLSLTSFGSFNFWGWLIMTAISWLIFGWCLYGKGSALMGIQTAVQTVQLDGVKSMRQAWKVEGRLTERITAVQGELSAGDLRQFRMSNGSRGVGSRPGVPPIPTAPAPPPLSRQANTESATPSDRVT